MPVVTAAAFLLMAIGILAVLRAIIVIARGGSGWSRLDLPVSMVGGFGLILVGQALLIKA